MPSWYTHSPHSYTVFQRWLSARFASPHYAPRFLLIRCSLVFLEAECLPPVCPFTSSLHLSRRAVAPAAVATLSAKLANTVNDFETNRLVQARNNRNEPSFSEIRELRCVIELRRDVRMDDRDVAREISRASNIVPRGPQ